MVKATVTEVAIDMRASSAMNPVSALLKSLLLSKSVVQPTNG